MIPHIKKLLIFTLFFAVCFLQPVLAKPIIEKTQSRGMIKGRVIDAETKAPVMGASVLILGTQMGVATEADGNFTIPKLPIGSYSLQFKSMGYSPYSKADIIVRPDRITFVEAELKISAIEMEGIVVTTGYFSEEEYQPTSTTNFSGEEIRRAPGSGGDVSRIIMGLPSLAKVDDQMNSLIVRGGSPVENAFFIDNIEIPNINHFPTQGASGGPIGMVNVDFIQDVNFYTGGFSSIYGDKLSSIMDITFREGNKSEFDGQLDLNFAGFGGVAEGPFMGKKGSWLFSIRRSYLDLIIKSINVGSDVAPRYGDVQGKIVYDINPNHKLTLLSVGGDDHNNPGKQTAVDNDMIVYGNQDIYENTAGVNWQALWNKNGYSNTSLSYTSAKFKEDFYETSTEIHLLKRRDHEQSLKLRNVNYFRLNRKNSIEFGVEAKHLIADYDNYFAEYTDALGDTVLSTVMDDRITADKFGLFINYIAKPFFRLTTNLGIRADYFSYNENSTVSPRFAFSYQLTEKTSINGSTGLFHQNLPMILLSQSESSKNLKDPLAIHYILGINHLITENTRFTLEVYQKDYRNFPLDPSQPALFLIDELYYRYGFFFNHESLIDEGKAYSRGIEIMIQKKLAKNFYGLASASYFRTRYKGGDGVWRDRVFDNRAIFSIEGGYKPNNKWEFSLRWIYAGGTPYTPLDIQKSKEINRAVLDENRINETRYPAYHSLNVRFDRRFNFKHSNIVLYVSVWNAYNRRNVSSYYWNEIKKDEGTVYQWGRLPIFGLEYEF